ncbi:hypothetical protein AJ78_00241 [Emergomyces pasteurianus Ep9510]|uniref:White collar 1 protein n=1 Tax=Emergomyces pasteurianus Ep9510 TaxID=1447872 RepID=A0A1J9PTZ9_9EURO|nr:hypothetical protein AJ78_00241 [Emergomyces pasteurianus Ep9510]
MDQSEEFHTSHNHLEEDRLHSGASDFPRDLSHERVQPVEDGDTIEDKIQGGHRQNPLQLLNYEMPQNMTLEIAASVPLECGGIVPVQQYFQAPTDVSRVPLDTSQSSTNILNGLHGSRAVEFYNASPIFYPFANVVSTAPGLNSSLEDRWNDLGNTNSLTHCSPDTSTSRLSTLSAGGFQPIEYRHQCLSDSKSLTDTCQHRTLRWYRDLQRNRPPYGTQRLLLPNLRKPIRNLQPQRDYPYEHQGQPVQSSIGFHASRPMKQREILPYEYPDWISRSNIKSDFNNPSRDILSDLKIYPDIGVSINDNDGSNSLPTAFPDNVAYQFPTENPTGEPNVTDVLNYITTRSNPEINIGAIDMSCSFAICRITARGYPIVYVSDAFHRLTGYSHEETVGLDCRFLQGSTGTMEPGLKRRTSDDRAIRHLKLKINARSEVQECLVNYRKGGQPFLNLLSVIPIRWLSDDYNFIVGFQLDLVESPQAVTRKNGDGSYTVNYRKWELAPNIYDPGGTISSRNEYLSLEHQGHVNININKARVQNPVPVRTSWDKMLLGSSEFLFHIISTTGVFVYVTPSTSTILEYEPEELNGSTISSICHPCDIVTVIREFRDNEPGSVVNLLYRIQRKISGYTWFESLGYVYIESTQKQKHIALLGKLLVVFTMSRDELMKNGGVNEGEVWAKISPSGILLFVSSSASGFLDRKSEDLVGESVQSLLSGESREGFENALGIACSGKRVTYKHELQHHRGHSLQVQSTIYPGEKLHKVSKPTFLILQIRLLKLGRTVFGFPASGATTRTRKKNSSNVTMRPTIAPDPYLCPGPDFVAQGIGNQNIRPSSSYSPYTGKHIIPRSVLKIDPDDITIYNSRQQEQPESAKENKENSDIFEELNPTRATNWQKEINHLKKRNRLLAEELQYLTTSKKRRKRKRDAEMPEKDCSQCHTKTTPEWRRGPSGLRDLCNSCGLRWAKQNGRITTSPRKTSFEQQKSTSRGRMCSASSQTQFL